MRVALAVPLREMEGVRELVSVGGGVTTLLNVTEPLLLNDEVALSVYDIETVGDLEIESVTEALLDKLSVELDVDDSLGVMEAVVVAVGGGVAVRVALIEVLSDSVPVSEKLDVAVLVLVGVGG